MRKYYILIALLAASLFSVYSQDIDVKKSDAIMEEGLQNYSKAAQLYEEAAKGYEQNGVFDTTCWYRAGVCNLKLKEYQKALTIFTKIEANNIVTGDLMLSMGDTYYGLKQMDKSEKYLLKAIEVDSQVAFDSYKKLVLVSYNSRQFGKAVEYADDALAIDSTDTQTMYIKTLSLEQQGKIDDAVISCEKLLEVKPNYSKGIEKMGLLYAQQVDDKYDREKKRYEAMKSPTRMDWHNSTKKLEAIGQEYKKAIPYLEKTLAKNPNNEVVKKTLDTAKSRMKIQ